MTALKYTCPKCDQDQYETGEILVAGGFWSKFFNGQGARFTTVICGRCRYTEFFQADSRMIGNIFDLFTN